MALTSDIHTFEIALNDSDRHVYEQLSFKVARHPSETEAFLWARVLAFCLEYREGIAFSKGGVSDANEPAIVVRDLTGTLVAWIDVGAPDAGRLHKAAKLASRVAVYTHRDPATLLRSYEGARIHRAEEIDLYAIDRSLLDALIARLDRRVSFGLAVVDRQLYVDIGNAVIEGSLQQLTITA